MTGDACPTIFAGLLLCLFVFAVAAGDRAPDIDWSRIVRSPEAAKYRPNLAGQYTVLQFLPNVTANAQAISRWNELIAKFRDKPVQFIWITSERWSAVEPFLREHPMDGWLLVDEKNEAAHAYGCNGGEDAIVDPAGRIVGFTSFLQAEQLAGVLDGNAVAIPRHAEDEQVIKLLAGGLLAGGKVRLESEPDRFDPFVSRKPDISPSYDVHISSSKTKGTDSSSGPDFWVQRGFDLKTIVSMVYERDLSRVTLPAALDNDEKFDFVMVLPREEDEKTIHGLVQRAIEKRFKVVALVESKVADVFVMTAIKGKTPLAKTGSESLGGGSISSSGFEFSLPAGTPREALEELLKHPENIGISNISADNTTMDEFRLQLERWHGTAGYR